MMIVDDKNNLLLGTYYLLYNIIFVVAQMTGDISSSTTWLGAVVCMMSVGFGGICGNEVTLWSGWAGMCGHMWAILDDD